MPDDYYVSKYSGEEIDDAIARALPGGDIDTLLAGKAPSTYLGNIPRNKIYKIGYYFKGSGESSSGAVAIRIRNFSDYGNENYMLAFLGAYAFSIEYHGQITTTYISKISVYSDPSVTGSDKKYTVFVTTQNFVDWASVYIDNEHSFTRNFADVTDTFSALVDGLDKVWESEYEYLNPPMQLGVEYRTTERYLGKPVYCKLVNFGALPNKTSKDVIIASDISAAASVDVIGTAGALLTNYDGITSVSCSPGAIRIATSVDMSDTSVYCLCKYTKTTD